METKKFHTDESQLPYAHWLWNIDGVGGRTIKYLLSKFGSPRTIYNLSTQQLLPHLTQQQRKRDLAQHLEKFKQNRDIHKEYQLLLNENIYFTCLGHEKYPQRLANAPDAPYGLYYKGRLPAREKPSVAIIGARNCSGYGRNMAERFGRELAMAGVQIISGMARGIDGIGQKAALLAGGYSLGVMGCGVDICYPSENKELYDMLIEKGGICSEYPPHTMPKNTLFPPRNRIISAMSDIVLVIEAGNRSGTLITVDMALEQGREVYALPGRITDALSDGCNRLIRQGAGIAVSPQDLIQSISENISGVILSPGYNAENLKNSADMPDGGSNPLNKTRTEILNILDYTPQDVDTIKQHMLLNYKHDISLQELMNELIKLCLDGSASRIGGSYFVKN